MESLIVLNRQSVATFRKSWRQLTIQDLQTGYLYHNIDYCSLVIAWWLVWRGKDASIPATEHGPRDVYYPVQETRKASFLNSLHVYGVMVNYRLQLTRVHRRRAWANTWRWAIAWSISFFYDDHQSKLIAYYALADRQEISEDRPILHMNNLAFHKRRNLSWFFLGYMKISMKCVLVDFQLHCAMVDDVWEERGRETASGCVQVHYDIPLIIFPNVQGWEER